MNTALIITLSFLGVSIILSLLAHKRVFRTINTVFTTISLILALFSIALYVDGISVQKQLAGEKLFVLGEGDTLQAAFYHGTQPVFIADTSSQRVAFAAHDYTSLRDERLMVIAHPSTFLTLTDIHLGDYTLSREKVLALIISDNIVVEYTDAIHDAANLPENQQLKVSDSTPDELRGLLFGALISDYLNATTFANAVNEGTFTVVPQGMTFWLVSIVPKTVLPYLIEAN